MSERQKSQRGFVAVTLITLLAIAAVLIVYASLLGTFEGGQVTVVSLNGTLKYNQNNSTTWINTTLSGIANGSSWYVMFNTTSSGYAGSVNITWTLQNWTGGSYLGDIASVSTNTFALNGNAGQDIYASTDGQQSGNTDWGKYTTTAGTYKIEMRVETA